MSITVKHINGDSTFLLTFSAPVTLPPSPGPLTRSTDFTILLDPWLSGPCQIWHPKFSLSNHVVPSCVRHLSELPEPDLILISQDKPDHCHEATLRQLPPDLEGTLILAEPAAAKKIKGWKYFEPKRVCTLTHFSDSASDTIMRFAIPPFMPTGSPGEVTIAFIPAKRDVTGLHNAIGITYRSPSLPKSPTASSTIIFPPTPPDSPDSTRMTISKKSVSAPILERPRTLSLIYSPHGVTYANIKPYAISHLVREAALPLTALLHSFDRVQNPWWLGGNISAGLPGGLEIAQNLLARAWISAHDEDKEKSGISVSNIKTRKYSVEEVHSMLEEGSANARTEVWILDVGEEIVLTAG
ncbi:hypothetical protein MMC16_001887 [Acarospora aff. strigata]|nr:hypothetical protein [Acarospora aff. strigata]